MILQRKGIWLSLGLWALLAWKIGQARQIPVGPGQQIKSIQKGLEIAMPGDTLWVEKGVYQEGNLELRKSLVLLGADSAILDGQGKEEILSVYSSDTHIEGFIFRNSGKSSLRDLAAIKVYGGERVTIKGNQFENNFFAVYFSAARESTVVDNLFRSYGESELLTGNGIHAWKSDSLIIRGNTVQGHRDGIYLEFVTHSLVEGNRVQDNHRYGLHFMFSNENAYLGNTFVRNGAGVAVMYTSGVRMEKNWFGESWGDAAYGLLLKDIRDSHIEGNHFVRNTTGILMEGSNRVIMRANQFESNGWALKMQSSCQDNLITENNFVQNTFDMATNGSLRQNRFFQNFWDKYEGYDLDRDRIGDIPYRPVSLYSLIVERYPAAMLLFHSFMVSLLDRTEQVLPSLVPEDLRDDSPLMQPVSL